MNIYENQIIVRGLIVYVAEFQSAFLAISKPNFSKSPLWLLTLAYARTPIF